MAGFIIELLGRSTAETQRARLQQTTRNTLFYEYPRALVFCGIVVIGCADGH